MKQLPEPEIHDAEFEVVYQDTMTLIEQYKADKAALGTIIDFTI